VRANVREFQREEFEIWRCNNCGSIHCLQAIDYERYYRDYPLRRQSLDFFTRLLLSARLRQLVHGGLKRPHSVLDYGCGNGTFVRYLRSRGYAGAEGYEPYSPEFSSRSVLSKRFDFVLSQDVIEHVPDPSSALDELLSLVRPNGGTVAIGTPDASQLNIRDPLDQAGRLHQPFHQHLLSSRQLKQLIQSRGFTVTRTVTRWYADTLFPFLNSNFLFRYVVANGGAIDAMFEPIRLDLVLGSPRLLFYGLFGGLMNPRKDVLVFASRPR
jgi:2-polyprenyl-3-methyl-5-hydroxy-6-metoxy-1,4-benzoquinol methylase